MHVAALTAGTRCFVSVKRREQRWEIIHNVVHLNLDAMDGHSREALVDVDHATRSWSWRRSMSEALVVRRETHLPAAPAAVSALLTDPEKILRWTR